MLLLCVNLCSIKANSVTIHGTPYKCGSVIRLKATELEMIELELQFHYTQIKRTVCI